MCDANPSVVYLSPGDPWNAPRGGQTAFAKQALNAFSSRMAVVAPSDDNTAPVGVWSLGEWQGRPVWRFNIGSYAPKNKSRLPLVPRRIVFRRLVQKYLPKIRSLGVYNVFCDSPELLDVLCRYRWDSVCYRFAGLSNPVEFSRYKRLRFLAPLFHKRMMKQLALLRPELLLASTDIPTIKKFESDNKSVLKDLSISFFPTRFDPSVFYPGDESEERRLLGWERYYPRLTIVGRLCWIKGWNLALESLALLKKRYPNILLTFVGDGEDRNALSRKIVELGLADNVFIEGFLPPDQVRRRIVASDLCLCASIKEGWSVATVEALACGKTLVSTKVSGSYDMISQGKNGVVVDTRDPIDYSCAVESALAVLQKHGTQNEVSLQIAEAYSLSSFANDWARLWKPLCD